MIINAMTQNQDAFPFYNPTVKLFTFCNDGGDDDFRTSHRMIPAHKEPWKIKPIEALNE